MPRIWIFALVIAGLLSWAPAPAAAQEDTSSLSRGLGLSERDHEIWAGISYQDAMIGLVAVGGGAVLVTWLTGSVISGLTASAAVAAAYIIFDPGPVGVLSPKDLPGLTDRASDQRH